MARLYCPKESIHGEQIIIDERRQIHYLRDVLRLKVGDAVFVFDGEANEYLCQIQESSKRLVKLLVKEKMQIKPQVSKCELAVACALPKQKNRFDDLVDKLSQLGVNKIIPMITKRTIIQWDSHQKQQHHLRWCKIAQAACSQSGRNLLAVIEPVKEINQILTHSEFYDLKLIPTLTLETQPLKDIILKPLPRPSSTTMFCLKEGRGLPKSILILIGPEGDFTAQELTQARNAGFIPVSLGDLVLRVDTAAIAVAAFFRLWGWEG